MRVILSDYALNKLGRMYEYIEREYDGAPQAYHKLNSAIDDAQSLLADNPKIGRVFHGENERFLVIGRYVFLYHIAANAIVIANIYGAGENWR